MFDMFFFYKQFEPVSSNGRISPAVEISTAPVIGIQVGLSKEALLNDTALSLDQTRNNQSQSILHDNSGSLPPKHAQGQPSRKSPVQSVEASENLPEQPQQQQQHVTFQNEGKTEKSDVSIQSIKNGPATVSASKLAQNHNQLHEINYITEEMQLKAAYELQLWKEAREREFEQEVFLSLKSKYLIFKQSIKSFLEKKTLEIRV
jgi:hypothetical protein